MLSFGVSDVYGSVAQLVHGEQDGLHVFAVIQHSPAKDANAPAIGGMDAAVDDSALVQIHRLPILELQNADIVATGGKVDGRRVVRVHRVVGGRIGEQVQIVMIAVHLEGVAARGG